jgi:hypothetical protein
MALTFIEVLSFALLLALPWVIRRGAKNKHFLNPTVVTVGALAALVSVVLSHDAMYLKIGAGLFTGILWMFGYRFRDQEQVVITALIGLGAIVILS